MKSLVFFFVALIASGCIHVGDNHHESNLMALSKDVTLNKSNIYQITEKAKMYLYLFNISGENDLGYYVNSGTENVPLISCEPLIKFLQTKGDTIQVGLNFHFNKKVVIPKQAANLEFYFLGNDLITMGNHDSYLEFDDHQQVKEIVDRQMKFLYEYIAANRYKLSCWLKCKEK